MAFAAGPSCFRDSGRYNMTVFWQEGLEIDDTVVAELKAALIDEPRKAAVALRTGEARRRVGDERRSSLYGFSSKDKARNGRVK